MKALIELIVLTGVLTLFVIGSYLCGTLLTIGSEAGVVDRIAVGLMLIGILASTKCVWKLTNLIANRFVGAAQQHQRH